MSDVAIFSGSANVPLATSIAKSLQLSLGKATVGRFSDGEIQLEIRDNVRGKDIFIIQPTCPPHVNDNLMELLVMVDALRRSSAARITAVVPYFGYARQDRKLRDSRSAITAKLVASMLESAGVDRMLTVDIHADQIMGFFDIPYDNVYASPILLGDIWKQNYKNFVVVSPDIGGVARARAIAKHLNDADLAIIDKRRPRANVSEVMNIIGDVENRVCILVDDIIDTAGTLCHAADALKAAGATKVVAYATHPVFSGNALKNIRESALSEVVVTDTIPITAPSIEVVLTNSGPVAQRTSAPEIVPTMGKIRQLSISILLAETIRRIHDDQSVSSLYID
jgi:ribose-phosphate pyrophosphokinase